MRADIANLREENSSLKRSGNGNQNKGNWTGAPGVVEMGAEVTKKDVEVEGAEEPLTTMAGWRM